MNGAGTGIAAGHVHALLLGGLWPLWLAAGLVDWRCHRRSDLEHSAGGTEWTLHVLQALQIGAAMAIALWLEPNALALASIVALVVLHTITAWVDTRYAAPRRVIGPLEQQVHAVLLLVPAFAAVLLVLLHPEAWRAPDWRWLPRPSPLPPPLTAALVLGTLLLDGLPLLEEGLRCARARRDGARAAVSSAAR